MKNIQFLQLAHQLVTDTNITANEFRIYTYLLTLYNDEKKCSYPSLETISNKLNISITTVKKSIKRLAELGYMKIEKKKTDRGFFNTYTSFKNMIKRKFNKKSNEEKESIKKKYGIAPDDKILIFTGRITPEKGVKELIESLKYVKYKNYKLLILGSALNELKTKTEYQEQLEDEVKKISDKVIFTGFIKYDEINTFYALADIAVLPSIWNDPAPLTIIESLMSGLPIITTNSGGIPEYATDGSAIILQINEKIVQNLSENIDYLLNNTKELKRMREKAIEVSKNLTLENYYFNFINIIKDEK